MKTGKRKSMVCSMEFNAVIIILTDFRLGITYSFPYQRNGGLSCFILNFPFEHSNIPIVIIGLLVYSFFGLLDCLFVFARS